MFRSTPSDKIHATLFQHGAIDVVYLRIVAITVLGGISVTVSRALKLSNRSMWLNSQAIITPVSLGRVGSRMIPVGAGVRGEV